MLTASALAIRLSPRHAEAPEALHALQGDVRLTSVRQIAWSSGDVRLTSVRQIARSQGDVRPISVRQIA